jgi:pimeloyl-ACP methyl ester carboxylesterase
MPIAHVDAIKLYYESVGRGPPLVLISGVGFGGWIWHRQVPEFAKTHRVITFDNRGVGKSDRPDETYTIETFATDTIGLLNFLKIPRAHILGLSLGGMIAQKLALDYFDRVDNLILVSTVFGGPQTVLPAMEVLQFMAMPNETPEERFAKGIRFSFGPDYGEKHPDEINFMKQKMSENRQPDYAYRHQSMAPLGFNAEPLLEKLRCPTLIIAGEHDRVVPVENARRLAQRIPNARLKILQDSGHLCFIEESETFVRSVLDFLALKQSRSYHMKNTLSKL